MERVDSIVLRAGTMDARQWLHPSLRLLLLLTSVLILVMPITEAFSNWERFLLGGSDVEFTLLAGLLFTALVLLTVERSISQPFAAIVLRAWARVDSTLTSAGSCASSIHRLLVSRCLLTKEDSFPRVCTGAMTPLRL